MDPNSIFRIKNEEDFHSAAISVFRHQYSHNQVYRQFCELMDTRPNQVERLEQIPFLPIEFFKSKRVSCSEDPADIIFSSSGTTSLASSKHYVQDLSLYEHSFRTAFEIFYGQPQQYCILALLPSYLEREGSSLVYMVHDLIRSSDHPDSGFFLSDLPGLTKTIQSLEKSKTRTLLIGVSYALLDLAEAYPMQLKHTVIMETGGMKGRRKELVREDLHRRLCKGFGLHAIHSEYGMTELLSQAYSKGKGVFKTPPWMKILIRHTEDPLSLEAPGKSGGINVIDLANLYSCSFIATQDLGRSAPDGTFEVLGRFDNADIRGCNLMVS
jgi:hypothetical protein